MNVYRSLNGVGTHLIVWGGPLECESGDVIVCVTGCPGIPEFYQEFGEKLHANTGLPVCLIGHAGHDQMPNDEIKSTKIKKDLYELDGQIQHKLDLIKNHVNKNCRMHLMAHSIGAFMLVELLNRNDYLLPRVLSVTLLYPTLQKMSETKMGFFLNTIIRGLHILALALLMIVQILPTVLVDYLIKTYLKLNSLPLNYVKRITLYLNPKIEENALQLAYECLDTVTDLNYAALNKIKNITNVIYSTKDHWVPMHHIEDLKPFQTQLRLVELNVDHAFVLRSSNLVADHVSEILKNKF